MKKQTPEEVERIQQAILEREVEEELQKERLINFWKKYRGFILGGLVIILGITIGSELHRSWYDKVRLSESDQFEQAVLLAFTGKDEQSNQIYQNLADSAKTGYKHLAKMRLAQAALVSNDTTKGIQYLTDLMNDGSASEELRDVARLAVVGHQIGIVPAEQLQKELQPLLDKQNEYYASAVELQAVLLLEQKKTTEAVNVLNKAIGLPTLSEDAKNRLKELLSIIQ